LTEARAQVQRELALIAKLGFAGYFLIVWDIVRYCQRQGFLVQGRGSAANSVVCYALEITAVDPVGMDLLFERFLNESRNEWPDIDLDLPSGNERESVIQYLYERYGQLGAAMTASHINLYGFWNETAFLTKSGDLGMVLSVPGVDYESLDHANQEYAVKRLEAALKSFGPGFHVYQYLFKSNRPEIPFASYDDPVVQAAIDQRRQFFEAKRDCLYQIEIFYCIVLEGARSKTGVGEALSRLFSDPAGAIGELKTQFTNSSMKTLLRSQIDSDLARLTSQVQAFVRQLADFMHIEFLNQPGQFRFFRRLLNYDDWRVAALDVAP
jgi:hypothetical protein